VISVARAVERFDAQTFIARHGGRKESRSAQSHEYLLDCRACGSSRLRWNAQKAAWICWGCKRSGTTVELVAEFEGVTLRAAEELICDSYVGGDMPTHLVAVEPPKVRAVRRLPTISLPAVIAAEQHPQVRNYLRHRNVDPAMSQAYGLCGGIEGATRGYVIFPVRMDGALVYWQGRASWDPPFADAEQNKQWVKSTRYRKTLNPRADDAGQNATAGEVLFNYDFARTAPHVVIVEGPFDAMQVGPHAVALLGQGTGAKLARLRAMGATRYTVYLDRDAEDAARRLAGELAALAPTYLATPPPGHDPGSLDPARNAAVIAAAPRYVGNALGNI